jgi:predicted Zn-dependent protease
MTMKKRIITIIMGVGFLGFMGTQIQGMIVEGRQTSQQHEQQAGQVRQQQLEELEAREEGYEKVLEREPNNQNALEGLVQTRINMKDYEAAVPPLEKLVELKPEREDYQEVLAQLKQATSPSQDQRDTSAEDK